MRSHSAFKPLGESAKQTIVLWRILLCMLHFDELRFARSFESFLPRIADVSTEFDASLEGFGVRLFDLRTGALIGAGRVKLPYDLEGRSDYQNTLEFICIVLSVAALGRMGYRGISLYLIGDSKTALSWGEEERYKGHLSH